MIQVQFACDAYDEDGVREGVARAVPSCVVDRLFFAKVPSLEIGRPVGVDMNETPLTKVLNKILGRETKDGGDDGEVARFWSLNVSAQRTLAYIR